MRRDEGRVEQDLIERTKGALEKSVASGASGDERAEVGGDERASTRGTGEESGEEEVGKVTRKRLLEKLRGEVERQQRR